LALDLTTFRALFHFFNFRGKGKDSGKKEKPAGLWQDKKLYYVQLFDFSKKTNTFRHWHYNCNIQKINIF